MNKGYDDQDVIPAFLVGFCALITIVYIISGVLGSFA